ncbi:MAG: bifunctional nuclease family protein [Acidimicrobiales bacterium]|jgi:bifunctional DNase/RNase
MTDVGAHDGSIEPGADLDANLDPDPDGGPHPPTPDTADGAIAGAPEPEPTPEGPVPTELAPTPLEVLRLSPEQWRIVAVASVEMTLPNANPMVVLHEAQDPWRELCIPVGLAEGTAIAYAYRGIETPRPLTHALVTEIFDRHGVSVEAVRITVRRGQQFFAEIDTMGPRGHRVLPCRPSDAIALALRQRLPTPILVGEWVFTGADAPTEIAGP